MILVLFCFTGIDSAGGLAADGNPSGVTDGACILEPNRAFGSEDYPTNDTTELLVAS
jgi:hypothetical protein